MIEKVKSIFKKKQVPKKDLEIVNSAIKTASGIVATANSFTDTYESEKYYIPSKDTTALGHSMISDNNSLAYLEYVSEISRTAKDYNDYINEMMHPKKMPSLNRLKNSITIQLNDFYTHKDFEYVGMSRVNGLPIYIYNGKKENFSKHNIEYTELF